MLCQLSIRNIAVIERAEITLGEGFNIITGETGAGKSIIIDSVNLILGERADRSLIRTGAENAYVEALFDVSNCPKVRRTLFEMYEDNDDELVISREISLYGRNACRINGRMATLQQLSKITKDLLDIHGQHEHQSLLSASNHIKVLDAFCGEELKSILKEYQIKLKEYNSVCDRIKAMEIDDLEKQRRLEMLTFQYEEISKMNLIIGEEDELRSKRDVLVHIGKIKNAIDNVNSIFSGPMDSAGIVSQLEDAHRQLDKISNINESFAKISSRIQQVAIECDDIYREIRSISPEEDFSQSNIDSIEGRISDLNRLKRKYGSTIEEILDYCTNIKEQIDDLNENEFVIEDLHKSKRELYEQVNIFAEKITAIRKERSRKLEQNIIEQLNQLGMERSTFSVNMISKKDENSNIIFMVNGKDYIEFLISTNPGEDIKPLSKIASGGEISRIMLALKTISSEVDDISTLIFDEIDTGISGTMSAIVAQKLATISNQHQVICVTHTAQIAAMADIHNYIEKTTGNLKANTDVKLLDNEERYKEISRLVGGNVISQYSDAHAKEIILWANSFKQTLV